MEHSTNCAQVWLAGHSWPRCKRTSTETYVAPTPSGSCMPHVQYTRYHPAYWRVSSHLRETRLCFSDAVHIPPFTNFGLQRILIVLSFGSPASAVALGRSRQGGCLRWCLGSRWPCRGAYEWPSKSD